MNTIMSVFYLLKYFFFQPAMLHRQDRSRVTATDSVPPPSVHAEALFQLKIKLDAVPESINT
jgi:hypothetical protein